MTESESDDLYVGGFAGNDQIDPSESLTGDNTQDPLDAGYTVPDREPHAWRGDTESETREGESLDDKLREEEPEVGEADLDAADEQPRSGRLVAPDEGAHTDTEADEIATDVGRDGQAASAEEAAMHVIGEDDPQVGTGSDGYVDGGTLGADDAAADAAADEAARVAAAEGAEGGTS